MRTGLCVEMQQGRNYETRRCSGVPNGADLDSCSWRARERKYSNSRNANCVCFVMTSKKRNDVTRQRQCTRHAAVRVSGGRPHEITVPRHWCATCFMLITVRSQKMCRTCFVLCGVCSITASAHTSTWSRKHAHDASSPIFPASALVALRTSTCPEHRRVRS